MEQHRWNALKPKEKDILGKVMTNIQECWPTSPVVSTEADLNHWKFMVVEEAKTTHKPWLDKVAQAWQKEGCIMTFEACRKKMRDAWQATTFGRLNMMLWRVLNFQSRNLPSNGEVVHTYAPDVIPEKRA